MRKCTKCLQEKPMDEYYHTGRYKRARRYECIECTKALARSARLPSTEVRLKARKERDDAVINMRIKQGISAASIARQVGVTPATVRNILARVEIIE